MVGRADLHTMQLIAVDCIRKKKRCCCHLNQLFKSIAGCPIDKNTITMTGIKLIDANIILRYLLNDHAEISLTAGTLISFMHCLMIFLLRFMPRNDFF